MRIHFSGNVSQLVEYMPCMHEVIGSNPIVSTTKGSLLWSLLIVSNKNICALKGYFKNIYIYVTLHIIISSVRILKWKRFWTSIRYWCLFYHNYIYFFFFLPVVFFINIDCAKRGCSYSKFGTVDLCRFLRIKLKFLFW